MESKAKLLGHPIHQMLIVFPLGLLATALIFDIIALASDNAVLFLASYWMIAAGVIGGLLAALFGVVDWLAIPHKTRAKDVGFWHGAGNVIVMALFAISWFLRRPTPDHPPAAALLLSLIAVAMALVTAWLGGELVDRLGVGVDDGAHLNSPSSLSGRPARQQESEPNIRKAA
jgi:uncharacterized membrane protein